jgi:hypothetical protein
MRVAKLEFSERFYPKRLTFFQKKEKQYIAVGSVKIFIKTGAKYI